MPSTINASNSGAGGLISAGDASGVLALQTAGTTAVTLDTSGNGGIGQTPVNSRRLTATTSGQTDLSIVAGSANYGQLLFGYTGADNKGIVAYNNSDNSMQFYTNVTERMRIDSSGNVLVGCTSRYSTIVQGLQLQASGSASLALSRTSDNGTVARFFSTSTDVGNISVTGSTTTFNSTSDYRLKENVQPMTGALAKVAQLKPVTYKWKVDGSDGQGFIAHELAEVVPDCVTGEKDALDKDGNPSYQGIDTSFLVATLTAAIQELKAINDTQAETLTQQTEAINALTARIVVLEGK